MLQNLPQRWNRVRKIPANIKKMLTVLFMHTADSESTSNEKLKVAN